MKLLTTVLAVSNEPDLVEDDQDADIVAPGSLDGTVALNSIADERTCHFNISHSAATFVASLLSSSSVTQRTVQSVIQHTDYGYSSGHSQ